MIEITSLQGEKMFINPDLIERMRSTPDTVLYLSGDRRLPVLDTPKEIIERIIAFRRETYRDIMNMRDFKVMKHEPETPEGD